MMRKLAYSAIAISSGRWYNFAESAELIEVKAYWEL